MRMNLMNSQSLHCIRRVYNGLFNKWWDAANANDRDQMADLLNGAFIVVRYITGKQWTKNKFLDVLMTDVRDKRMSENRCLIYDNDKIIVSNSILDGPSGKHAVMFLRLVKDGKIYRTESGITLPK